MKKVLNVVVIIMLVIIFLNFTAVLGFGGGFDYEKVPVDGMLPGIKTPIDKVTNTVILIFQILSIAGVIILGVKYMYGSAEKKADYKKTLLPVIIGLVLVFATSTVSSFIMRSFDELVN